MGMIEELLKEKYKLRIPPTVYYDLLADVVEIEEQEPKTGHWIDNMDLGYHVSICSNCDWRGHGDACLIYKPKFCPNCGARMVGTTGK